MTEHLLLVGAATVACGELGLLLLVYLSARR
jgi:hypothetical protein